MTTKLTPRQNEIISEALVAYAVENFTGRLPKDLKSLRESLVTELKAVTADTDLSPTGLDFPSIAG